MSEQSTTQPLGSGEQIFNQFCDSNNFREILQLFNTLCSELKVDPNQYEGFYPSLKSCLTSWKATSLFKLLDDRSSLPEYEGGRACAGRRVLVVGAGPVGLRGAIELALLGARVDLVEKRPDFQRNNSLHLWPFLITDLRNLGAKKFYGKFASGSIEHICIRILQAILLKICLLLGVKVHAGVTFNGIIEPKDAHTGWRADTTPTSIASNDYDVILAADGKQQSLSGFRAKEFRAKLALAITVNFVNHNTQAENSVPEIGGVAFVYRQEFFNSLAKIHDIELENIVYYKDETHYLVMTVRKQSLLRKGVLKTDLSDPKQLLSKTNIDRSCLEQFALEATSFATEGGLGKVEFEKNHRGEKDVALFDFTSLFAAENAARIIERKGRSLLLCLAGDSLIEPFWPTGSGCARGFLGVFDNAWMIKRFCLESATPLELIEERESILYLLPQTTPHRLSANFSSYTINPKTRYLNLSELVPPGDVSHLYDTDNRNTAAVSKSRTSVQPPSQDKPKPADEQTTVEPTMKRSKSSEVLSSDARSAIPTPSRNHTPTPSHPHEQTSEPSIATLKNIWQKRMSVKNDKGPTKQDAAPQTDTKHTPKEVKTATAKASTKLTPKDAKSTPKSTLKDTKQTRKEEIKSKPSAQEAASKTVRTRTPPPPTRGTRTPPPPTRGTRTPPPPTRGTRTPPPSTRGTRTPPPTNLRGRESPVSELAKLTPVKQQQSPSHKTNAKPPPAHASPKPKKTDKTVKAVKKETEKPPSSPKWSRFLSGSKLRARSESPEPSPKHGKKLFDKDSKSVKKHPLQVSRSLQNLNEEAANDETSMNVQDIVKKYDLRAESVTQTGGRQSSTVVTPSDKGGSKGKDAPKTKKTDEKKSKKDKDTKESKGGFFSFFKSRKLYDVAAVSSNDKKSSTERPLNEQSEQPIVRRRIKQFGHMTDGVEDTDGGVVLMGVTPLVEDGNDEEMITSESPTQSETEDTNILSAKEKEYGVSSEGTGETPSPEGKSPVPEDITSGEIPVVEGNSPEASCDGAERVKKLKEVFSSSPAAQLLSRHSSYNKRSKEIDLSDVLNQKSKPASSHPLWLARVTQGLNMTLERLRRENEMMATKTALEILNTILSNVQAHPESDVYRRVRVSSESFSLKVWQLRHTSQFMARAGWVEIDEFIVLPMDAEVDNAKRVLDKHLNIVNQMLWSRQLELPPTGVVKISPRERGRAVTLTKRMSYATRLVDESLKRIEEDPILIAHHNDTVHHGNSDNTVPPPIEDSDTLQQRMEEPNLDPEKSGGEEEVTMKAASLARNIWKQRSDRQVRVPGPKDEVGHVLITDTELYDLPHSSRHGHKAGGLVSDVADTAEGGGGSHTRSCGDVDVRLLKLNQSANKRSSLNSAGGQRSLEGNNEQASAVVDSNIQNGSKEDVAACSSSPGSRNSTPSTGEDALRSDTPQSSSSSPQEPPLTVSPQERPLTVSPQERPLTVSPQEHPLTVSPQERPLTVSPQEHPLTVSPQEPPLTVSPQERPLTVSPSRSARGDQLRQLLGTGSPEEEAKNEVEDRPTQATDAQHSTVHSILNERVEYGNLTMEVAAQTRQRWKETEEASLKATKDKANPGQDYEH